MKQSLFFIAGGAIAGLVVGYWLGLKKAESMSDKKADEVWEYYKEWYGNVKPTKPSEERHLSETELEDLEEAFQEEMHRLHYTTRDEKDPSSPISTKVKGVRKLEDVETDTSYAGFALARAESNSEEPVFDTEIEEPEVFIYKEVDEDGEEIEIVSPLPPEEYDEEEEEPEAYEDHTYSHPPVDVDSWSISTISPSQYDRQEADLNKIELAWYTGNEILVDESSGNVVDTSLVGDSLKYFGALGAGENVVYVRNRSHGFDARIVRKHERYE